MRMKALCLTVLFLVIVLASSQSIDFGYYHTTFQINEMLKKLSNQCQGFKLNQASPFSEIYELNVESTSPTSNKALLIFGEHPREMISPETGLNLVQALCRPENQTPEISNLSQEVRAKYNLKIILNSNPEGRKLVEGGDYCRRENLNKVDINRNWGSHWIQSTNEQTQTSSGSEPFSEKETQTLKKIADEYEPKVFISIHSGTLGLYTPFAYSNQRAERNEEAMLNIVNEINQKFCNECGVGAAGKEVGYLCPGTCLDYIYENLRAEYSFAYEIYQKGNPARPAAQALVQILEKQEKKSLRHRKNTNQNSQSSSSSQSSCFIQNKSQSTEKAVYNNDEYENCFSFFNPTSSEEYTFVTQNWTQALLETLTLVP